MGIVRIASVRRFERVPNLCFEQKYEKYQYFLSENFQFLVVKFSIYLDRRVFVMEENTGIYVWGIESLFVAC